MIFNAEITPRHASQNFQTKNIPAISTETISMWANVFWCIGISIWEKNENKSVFDPCMGWQIGRIRQTQAKRAGVISLWVYSILWYFLFSDADGYFFFTFIFEKYIVAECSHPRPWLLRHTYICHEKCKLKSKSKFLNLYIFIP